MSEDRDLKPIEEAEEKVLPLDEAIAMALAFCKEYKETLDLLKDR